MFCFCNQKLADISCCYLPVQLNRADILYSVVSTVELTLTLLEVPSLAVVVLVPESEDNSCCSQGTTTEIACNLLLWLSNSKPAYVFMLFIFVGQDRFFFLDMSCDEYDQSSVCEVTYLHMFAWRMTLL